MKNVDKVVVVKVAAGPALLAAKAVLKSPTTRKWLAATLAGGGMTALEYNKGLNPMLSDAKLNAGAKEKVLAGLANIVSLRYLPGFLGSNKAPLIKALGVGGAVSTTPVIHMGSKWTKGLEAFTNTAGDRASTRNEFLHGLGTKLNNILANAETTTANAATTTANSALITSEAAPHLAASAKGLSEGAGTLQTLSTALTDMATSSQSLSDNTAGTTKELEKLLGKFNKGLSRAAKLPWKRIGMYGGGSLLGLAIMRQWGDQQRREKRKRKEDAELFG